MERQGEGRFLLLFSNFYLEYNINIMTESFSINASPQGNPEEKLRAQIGLFARKRVQQIMNLAPAGSDKKAFLIDTVSTSAKGFFEGGEDLLAEFLDSMRAAQYDSDEALEEGTAVAMTNSLTELAERITPNELLRRYRERANKDSEAVTLDANGMFTYTIYADAAEVHIKGFEFGTVSDSEKPTLLKERFSEALHNLAKIVGANESIHRIELVSPIVGEYPRFIKRFGFSMVDLGEEELKAIGEDFPSEMKGKKVGKAQMTREEFLKQYASIEGQKSLDI